VPIVVADARRMQHWVDEASDALNHGEFVRSRDEGRQMTTDQAVRYALDEPLTSLP
jgi:hypothetical protein